MIGQNLGALSAAGDLRTDAECAVQPPADIHFVEQGAIRFNCGMKAR